MSYRSFRVESVYFVRWQGPTTADVEGLLAQVREAHGRLGRKLICVALAGEESRPTDDKVRKMFADHTSTLFQHCEELHMIIEGQGFRAALVRSVTTHLLMLTRRQWKITIHSSMDDALVAVARRQALDAATLSRAIQAEGFMPAVSLSQGRQRG